MGTREEKIKNDILTYLEKIEEKTSQIAEWVNVSRSTASKYLQILEAEGKVRKRKQTPYIHYSLQRRDKMMRDNALYLRFGSDKGETK